MTLIPRQTGVKLRLLKMEEKTLRELKNLIGGELWAPATAAFLDDTDPATGEVFAKVPASDFRDVDAAVKAAKSAFPGWARLSAAARGAHLRKLARLIERDLEIFAAAESRDTGKPLALAASVDIPRAIQNFDFFADAATQFSSESHATPDSLNYTLRSPLGAVACISPWNLPLYLLSWKIAPALAAGNTVVAKPSEVTPMTAAMLGDLSIEAGMPKGVLNLVHGLGPEVGAPLVAHEGISAISFTGSTRVGRDLAIGAGARFKKISLEMGGKNATLVFADADLELAARECVRGAFSNQGQICLCGSRILIERSVYQRFTARLIERVRALRIGDPRDGSTDQGAIVSTAHFDKIIGCLTLARAEGGQILCGGTRHLVPGRCANGLFIEPTLIEGLGPKTRTNQEEIFGPVATLQPFDSEAHALELANAVSYGLAATVFTKDLSRAHRVSSELRAGIVWINCWMQRDLRTPFGGIGESGVGREGGLEAMRFFTEPKNVCVKLESAPSP